MSTELDMAARVAAIGEALNGAGIESEVFTDEDGDNGWYIAVHVGDEIPSQKGGTAAELSLSYWTRDATWQWTTTSRDGSVTGPWPENQLPYDADPADVVEYVQTRLGQMRAAAGRT